MPTIRLVIWNVEDFGTFTDLKRGEDDERLDGTLYAIAQVILSCDADIFVMQECRRRGRDHLPALVAHLGDDWHYDYLPGSIRAGVHHVAGFGDLDYTDTGNREGYAVLWCDRETLRPFAGAGAVKMSRGRNGNAANSGYINLATQGSRPHIIWNAQIPVSPDDGGFGHRARFPRPDSAAIVNDTNDPARQQANQNLFRWPSVRRPALITVRAEDADDDIPVVVYHAPNGGPSPFYAGLAAALTEPMGDDDDEPVIFGGDMNMTTQNEFTNTHFNFNVNLDLTNGTAAPGGANAIREFGYRRTQVQYVYPAFAAQNGLIQNGRNYEHPRDILYYRHLDNVEARVVDVLDQLQDEDSDLADAIFFEPDDDDEVNPIAFSVDDAIADGGHGPYRLPGVVRANANLMNQLQAPFEEDADPKQFATRLAAATFYRLFISDHLPLYIEFDIDEDDDDSDDDNSDDSDDDDGGD